MVVGYSEADLQAASSANLLKWITTAKRLFTIASKEVDTRLANLAQREISTVLRRSSL